MTSKVRLLTGFVLTAGLLVLTATAAFAQCKFPDLPYAPMSAVIAEGGYLTSDGRGGYVDSIRATVNLVNAANLVTNDGTPGGKMRRYLTLTWNGPVVGDSLAQSLGIIQDREGEVHAFTSWIEWAPTGFVKSTASRSCRTTARVSALETFPGSGASPPSSHPDR